MVTLRIGSGVALAGAGAVCGGGDAVPDGDFLWADEDVLDEQPQDALAVFDGGGGGVAAELGDEAFQVIGEGEVGVPAGGLGVEGVDLAAQVCLPGTQVRHLGAQFVDGDQLLGVRLDHGGDRGGGLGQGQFQLLALPGGRVGGAGLLEPLADLGADQGRVGEEGQGLKIALTTLNTGRLALPASCAATGKLALKIAREWSRERVQWGRPIGEHEAVAKQISFIAATTYAMEAVLELSSQLADDKRNDIRIEAALAKLYCSEMASKIADELVQVRGGRGYETASSLAARGERGVPAEQMLRDMRINRIFEGSSEIMRLIVAREAVDAHLSAAGELIDPGLPPARRARAAAQAGGFYARWLPTLVTGEGQRPGAYSEFGSLAAHLRYAERASRKLARATFYGMARWQGRLEHKQGFLGRIVDIGAELFAISAACVRAQLDATAGSGTERGAAAPELAGLFCAQARLRAEELFSQLWSNTDTADSALARRVLTGRYSWLEDGIIDPSIPGPWIAPAEPGPSKTGNVHRHIS